MEQQVKNNIIKKKWQQMSYVIRQKIEVLSKLNHSAQEIARAIGYSKRTIERELKRGQVKVRRLQPDSLAAIIPTQRQYKEIYEYSADIGQEVHEQRASAKGIEIKLGKNYGFCKLVTKYIKDGFSPYSTLKLIEHNEKERVECGLEVCTKTLYNYIHKGYIPQITVKDLPERGAKPKRSYNRVRIALNNTKGRSIEERPSEVEARETFGHWEFDCVESGKGGKATLLVMSERLTRQELIFKLKSKTQAEVVKAINSLEKQFGVRRFSRVFRTVTLDNGCEFLNQTKLEQSISSKEGKIKKRFEVYYCHPYSAYERGTNENINRMIRRYTPKGANIGNYSPKQIKEIQNRINATPRFILDGYPSNIKYKEYIT